MLNAQCSKDGGVWVKLLGCSLRALCVVHCALLVSACSRPVPASEANYLIVAQRTSPNSLDPRLASDEATARIGQLVVSALLSIGDDLRPRPQLAERLDNPDPLHYVAHLRHDVKFHDGHELTSRDVVY